MKAPGTHAPAYRARFKTEADQLVPTYHPVLALGKLGDRCVPFARPQQCSYIGLFCGLGGHSLRLAGNVARVVR
jgi:hypothetical protein